MEAAGTVVQSGLPEGHPLAAAIVAVTQAGPRGPIIPSFGKPEGDDWGQAGEFAGGGQARSGATAGDDWAESGRSLGDDWAESGRSSGDDWAEAGGSAGDDWAEAGGPEREGWAPGGEADGWVRVDEAAVGGRVGVWLEEIRQVTAYGHRQAAAVKLAEVLAQAVLAFAVQSVFLTGVAPDLSPGNVWVRWRDGRVDAVALAEADVSPGGGELDEWLASRVAATLGPLLAAIRAGSRASWVTLWGRVADVIHVQMLRAAKDLGYDTRAAWQRAAELTDAIAAVVPRLRLRPRPFPVHAVDSAGGDWDGVWPVFGTCCFLYKARPDIRQCNVCPLRSDDGRCFDWPQELPPAPLVAEQAEAS